MNYMVDNAIMFYGEDSSNLVNIGRGLHAKLCEYLDDDSVREITDALEGVAVGGVGYGNDSAGLAGEGVYGRRSRRRRRRLMMHVCTN